MARSKVLIANEGGYGRLSATKGDYDDFVEMLKDSFEDPELAGTTIAVEVTGDVVEAFPRWRPVANEAVVVFVTRGMLFHAQLIAERNRALRVVVLTGETRDLGDTGRVVVIDKDRIGREESIPQLILGEEDPAE